MIMLVTYFLLSASANSQVGNNVRFDLSIVKNGEMILRSSQVIPMDEVAKLIKIETNPFIQSVTIHNERSQEFRTKDMSQIESGYALSVKPSKIGNVIILDIKGLMPNLTKLKKMEGGVEDLEIDDTKIGQSFAFLDGETRLFYAEEGSNSIIYELSAQFHQ